MGFVGAALVVTMAATAAYSGWESHHQASEAQDRADRQADLAKQQLDAQNKSNQDKETLARQAAIQQRKRDYENLGRGSTILTSPMGIPGTPAPKDKTLLGL